MAEKVASSTLPENVNTIVVGTQGSGKSSLVRTVVCGECDPAFYPRYRGRAFGAQLYDTASETVQVSLWNAPDRQPEFTRYLTNKELKWGSFASADVVMYCFALDNEISLWQLKDFYTAEVRKHGGDSVPHIVVGTKLDLRVADEPKFRNDERRVATHCTVIAHLSRICGLGDILPTDLSKLITHFSEYFGEEVHSERVYIAEETIEEALDSWFRYGAFADSRPPFLEVSAKENIHLKPQLFDKILEANRHKCDPSEECTIM